MNLVHCPGSGISTSKSLAYNGDFYRLTSEKLLQLFSSLVRIGLLSPAFLLFLACSNSRDDAAQPVDNGFRVIDSAINTKASHRIIYFSGKSISENQLRQMQKVSGFELQPIKRNLKDFIFVEIRGADRLSRIQLEKGLDAINSLPFVNKARFEPLVNAVIQD